jgi:hypothetical protein
MKNNKMIKYITSLLLIFTIAASPQLKGQGSVTIDIGFSLANFGGASIETSNKLALTAGVGYEHWLSERIGLQSSISYMPKGAKLGVVGNLTQFTYRLNYWESLNVVKYKLGTRPDFHISLLAGPNISTVANANIRFFSIATPTTAEVPRGENGVNSLDYGLNLGTEFNLETDYGYLSLKSYYQYGLQKGLLLIDNFRVNNNMLFIGLTFKIGTSKKITEASSY